jgi:hypothetical protein
MSNKSGRIGKDFEYEVRDILREATGDLSFERVPNSGAYFGGANQVRALTAREGLTEIMSGDIITPPGWRWVVECKNHEDVPYHQLFIGGACKAVDEFLDQINVDAGTTGKEPLLFVKLRRKGYKLSKKVRDAIEASGEKIPQSKSSTIGTVVAERSENCGEIAHFNHIQYTCDLPSEKGTTWRFFDIDLWITEINKRSNKNIDS